MKEIGEIVKMPVVYRLPGMDAVRVTSDIKYAADGPHLLMDFYLPAGLKKGERRPAVIFVHGNVPPGSPAKNMGVFRSWGRLTAASGMIGVSFTHRLGYPEPHLEKAADDLKTAIDFVRNNGGSFAVDTDRIALFAFSGGGPLLSPAIRERPPFICCLAAFYAFLDIRESDLYAGRETPDLIEEFSPINHLTRESPPIFIARAGRDETPGINPSIDRFIGRAISVNAPISLSNPPNGVHMFDSQNDDPRSREMIGNTLSFFRFHLEMARAIGF
ncbi:MAG: alpha/beta hydrolase [Pyrinomonadaceae bacterium]